MAYHIEGKDIVINGFEQGIADTPYSGVADMRNMEIVSIQGEAFVEFANTTASVPPVMNAVAFTAQAAGDTITVASTTGLYEGCAITLNTNTATGITTGVVYYVMTITSTTFQIRAVVGTGSAIDITGNGSGTLTTYQYAGCVSYWVDNTGGLAGSNSTIICDNNAHVWVMLSSAQVLPADKLYFLGNIGGVAASGITFQNGVAVWNGYLLLFGLVTSGVDYVRLSNLWVSTAPASAWHYTWQVMSTNGVNGRVSMLVSKEDGNLYWISNAGLGSLIEEPGTSFDPTNAATYAITDTAISIPEADESTCLAELGQTLLIGGRFNFVYVWDKVSIGFSNLLNIPDNFTTFIVASSQNAYIFAGNRGRIYISNGSGIDLYKKIPDYLTGVISPFMAWQDANFYRNQLLFGFSAKNNASTTLASVAGVWAIDLETDALRMLNKLTSSGYGNFTNMICPRPADNSGQVPSLVGTGLAVGWTTSGNAYGLDIGSANPYTAYESYLQTEIIPVGTFLDQFSPSQVEWKTSTPLVNGEGVRVSYRTNITESFTTIGETLTVGALSDMFQANFQKVQWVQFLVELKSTATTPSYTRLTEMRVRDYPSGNQNQTAYSIKI